jgi:hypothetical protein
MHEGLQDIIIPYPMSSSVGIEVLRKNKIVADVILVDGSHLYEDVKMDILLSHEKISDENTIIIGDDWNWSDVRRAAEECQKELKKKLTRHGGKYWTLE